MNRVADLMQRYFISRSQQRELDFLNEIIRELRVLVQEVLTERFLPLPLPEARNYRFALADRLYSLCKDINGSCPSEHEQNHYRYCVQQLMTCFEWAEQIKEEIPDDPVTQKILVVDIPILRPFCYDFKLTKRK